MTPAGLAAMVRVRGRRFMRPTLTAVADGREQRILAVLDHKPWNVEDGESWLAVFPCSTDPAALVKSELTVAPDLTVPLPPPSTPAARRRPRRGAARTSSPATRRLEGPGPQGKSGSVASPATPATGWSTTRRCDHETRRSPNFRQ